MSIKRHRALAIFLKRIDIIKYIEALLLAYFDNFIMLANTQFTKQIKHAKDLRTMNASNVNIRVYTYIIV